MLSQPAIRTDAFRLISARNAPLTPRHSLNAIGERPQLAESMQMIGAMMMFPLKDRDFRRKRASRLCLHGCQR